MTRPFHVQITNCFFTLELLDSQGREIRDMYDAADAAECEYGCEWESVFNGDVAISREEWTGEDTE